MPRHVIELALAFLRLGLLSFGGPAVHIAMMEREFVQKRGWITHEELLRFLAAANLIPGPSSSEVALFIGRKRAGGLGLLVAGLCFILPAAVLVGCIAWAYVRFGKLPAVAGILYGAKPVIVGVILAALLSLGKAIVKVKAQIILFAGAIGLSLAGAGPIEVLLAGGIAAMFLLRHPPPPEKVLALLLLLPGVALAEQTVAITLGRIFAFFLKIGAVQYGSGYVLLAFLKHELVEKLHWITTAQLVDAIAVGQFTPGPVFTTATFIGFLLAGAAGAALATVGIFTPAFLFVAFGGHLIEKIQHSARSLAFLDGVGAASLGLIAVVAFDLGREVIVDPLTAGLAVGGAVLVAATRVNPAWPILAGALIGMWKGG